MSKKNYNLWRIGQLAHHRWAKLLSRNEKYGGFKSPNKETLKQIAKELGVSQAFVRKSINYYQFG